MTISNKSAEQLKHRHSQELEAQKWAYKKEELQYVEAGQHLRSLNQLMWQVPGMAIAITGGLWYGATTIDTETPRTWVLGFVSIVDILTIVIIWRLRRLIELHIGHQRDFSGTSSSTLDPAKGTVVACWTIALLAAAIVSALGAAFPSTIGKKPPLGNPTPCCTVTVDFLTSEATASQCPPAPRRRIQQKKTVQCNP